MNQAQELFNKIQALKNANEFIEFCSKVLGPIERFHFDFKEKRDSRDATFHDDDRRNLAKAISGFANSGGGVLIWGIEDTTLKPITNIKQFIQRSLELAPQITDPMVGDIDGFSIDSSAEANEGYGIVFIPESVLPPHRVTLNLDGVKNHYFVRSGNVFNIASHTMLEDMFGRRPKPELNLTFHYEEFSSNGDNRTFKVILGIENKGRGSAKSPFLSVRINKPYIMDEYGVDGNMNFGLIKLVGSNGRQEGRYGSSQSEVIHPGIKFDITKISVTVNLPSAKEAPDLTIIYKIAAEGMQLIEKQEVIKITTILSELGHPIS